MSSFMDELPPSEGEPRKRRHISSGVPWTSEEKDALIQATGIHGHTKTAMQIVSGNSWF